MPPSCASSRTSWAASPGATHDAPPPIVALALCRQSPAGIELRIIPVEPGEDPEDIARVCIQAGHAHLVGALTRRIEPAELAPYVPGIARSPDVAWIAAMTEEQDPHEA